jgi:transketolase
MRNKFAEVLYKISKKNKKIRVVAADISPAGKMAELSKKYPDRFINVGVAESSMISMCAGLAMHGFKPFAYTIASFALFRPFEMVRIDIGYQNLPVVIVGMGAGTVYSTLGGTHITPEDVSVVRCLPNFKVLVPCDSKELASMLIYLCKNNKSPCYLRIGKSGEKDYSDKSNDKWEIGKPRIILDGKKDICLVASGPIIRFYFSIIKELKKKKIFPTIISYHTLKPLNDINNYKFFKKFKSIITLEDISEINGLSQIIKGMCYDHNYRGLLFSFALKDKNIKNYGTQDDLLKDHGITAKNIYNKILSFNKKINSKKTN